jgi:chromate transporter
MCDGSRAFQSRTACYAYRHSRGAVAGFILFRKLELSNRSLDVIRSSKPVAYGCASAFFALLISLPLFARYSSNLEIRVFSAFYRSGALVFGGEHVVLPLLENAVVARGWVTQQSFLAGYGAAQALPGPLFTLAAFLGASIQGAPNRFLFGVLALAGISAPGLLAMAAVLPFWGQLRRNRPVQSALRGVNAAVVGVLGAALYTPLWTSTIRTAGDFWFATAAFVLLTMWKVQPWIVVVGVSGCYLLLKLI